MNITFFIGNGLDLNYKLKTSYQDFYKYYMTLPGSQQDFLARSIMKEPEIWSDLEIGLGACFGKTKDEQLEEFFDSKFRLEEALVDYLINEQKKFVVKNEAALIAEFKKKIVGFYGDLTSQDQREYREFLNNIGEINYTFVTFNYTNILDGIVERSSVNNVFSNHERNGTKCFDRIKPVIHIHGTLNEGFILGIDSEKQGAEGTFVRFPKYRKLLIKRITNKNLKNNKNETVEKAISDSRYICLYGLSIGETDESWWKQIANWLNQNSKNRLIIYNHLNGPVPVSAGKKLALDDSVKDKFILRSKVSEGIGEKIYPQIMVLHNSNIFDFENVGIEDDLEFQTIQQKELVGAV